MSKRIEPTISILPTSTSNLAAANSTWFDSEGADKLFFDVTIVGTANAHLDLDYHNANAATATLTYTANGQYIIDDPVGKVRAWCDGVGANSSARIRMRRIFVDSK